MRQRGGGTRLAKKARDGLVPVRGAIGAYDLECDLAEQPRVERAIDLAHSAAPDHLLDRVALERLAGLEGHIAIVSRLRGRAR